jgi:small conductance mechanosensitive channel
MGTTTNAIDKIEYVKTKLIDLGYEKGPSIFGALVILVVGWIIARWLCAILMRSLERKEMEPPVRMLIVRAVRLLVLVFTLLVALATMGADVTAMVAGLSVAGVGIGLATQGVLSNMIAGLTIIFTKPFRVGEYVELAGVQGQVRSIELFSTVLTHPDMSTVVVPNRKIVGDILHNYGKIRQLDLTVGVAYGTNTAQALALLREIVCSNPRVLKSPEPVVGISTLSDSSINIAIRPWTSVADSGVAGAEIYQSIITLFRQQNIEIPFPQREVRLINGTVQA